MLKQFVIYTRVSTSEQAKSGLGIEAQKADIDRYLAGQDGEVIAEFCDTGSGADDDRPELVKALKIVRKTGAELVVSKLDRLSRDVAMIATLMKDRDVAFRVASMPSADKFAIHIYACLAEQEREMISLRTRQALKAAKLRGVLLGGKRDGAIDKANAARARLADRHAAKVWPLIQPLLNQGLSLRSIADRLNESGVKTASGANWQSMTVSRVIKRMEVVG